MSANNNNVAQQKRPGQGRRTRRGRRGQGPKQPNMANPQSREFEYGLLNDDKKFVREHVVRGYAAEPAILAFVDPELSGGFRWSEPMTNSKTAVCTPQLIEPVGFNTTDVAPASDPLNYQEVIAISRRIPQCATIVFDHNTSGRTKQYDIYMMSEQLSTPATSGVTYVVTANVPEKLRMIYAKANSGVSYQPHGPKLYAGTDPTKDRRFLWVDFDDVLSINITTSAAAVITVTPHWYNVSTNQTNIGPPMSSAGLPAGANHTFPILANSFGHSATAAGFYLALDIAASVNSTLTVNNANISGGGRCFAHKAIGDYHLNDGFIQRIRMLGVSQMFSNRCNLQYRQGKVCGAQLDDGTPWTSYLTFESVIAVSGAVRLDADKGMYSFLKPHDDSEIELNAFTLTKAGSLVDSFWPLAGFGAYLVTAVSIAAATGRDGEWTFDQAIEYTTTNKFVELRRPTMSFQLCQRAVSTIGGIQQFHENPLHMRELVAAAKKAARSIGKGVTKYAPDVIAAVTKYGPQAIELAQLLSSLA